MFVLELYFLLYRLPKMMTRLARERRRSALAWSLIAIGAWIGTEFLVLFAFGFVYAIGIEFFDWPVPAPAGLKLFAYIVALVAALLSATIVSRLLTSKSAHKISRLPPPPPEFSD
jgi:hypothetical protein